MWQKILSRIYKEHLKINNKKTISRSNTKWGKVLNSNFTKEDVWMGNKHMKRCSILFRELEIKTTMSYYYQNGKPTKQKTLTVSNAGQDAKQLELSSIGNRNVK